MRVLSTPYPSLRRALILALPLLLLATPSSPLAAPPVTPGRQVVHAEQIEQAGITRLSELVWLAGDWAIASIDGYTWRAAPGGLAPFEGQDWAVMLDGVVLQLEILDQKLLDRLPIQLAEIDSVEFFSTPTLVQGHISDRGLMHIHSRRPAPGLSAGGSYFRGNESGEPGPWKYVPGNNSPNVDKMGPDYGARASLRAPAAGDSAWFAAQVRGQFHFVSGKRLDPRLNLIWEGTTPKHRTLAASGRASLPAGPFALRLFGGRSQIDEHHFFFQIAGRELPTTATGDFATLLGVGELLGSPLRFSASWSGNELGAYRNAANLDPDFRRDDLHGNVEASRQLAGFDLLAGFRYHAWYESSRWIAYQAWRGIGHSYAAVEQKLGESVGHRAVGDFALTSTASGGSMLWQGWYKSLHSSALLGASYTERLLGEDPASWYSNQQRGYWFLQPENDVTYEGPSVYPAESIRHSHMNLELRHKPCPCGELRLELGWRHVFGMVAPWYRYSYGGGRIPAFGGSTHYVYSNVGGNVFTVSASASGKPLPTVSHRLGYRFLNATDGDPVFVQLWKPVPMHSLRWQLAWAVAPSFRIAGSLNWQSATSWPAYAGAELRSGGFFNEHIGPLLWSDLTLHKSFAGEAIDLGFTFRNLFGEELYFHPIGTRLTDLAFLVQLELQLDSLWDPWAR